MNIYYNVMKTGSQGYNYITAYKIPYKYHDLLVSSELPFRNKTSIVL